MNAAYEAKVTEEHTDVVGIALGITLPIVTFEAFNLVSFGFLKFKWVSALQWADYCAVLVVGGIALTFSKLGRDSGFAAIFGTLIAIWIETEFRGSHVRRGTLDFFESSHYGWSLPLTLASVVGLIAGTAMRRGTQSKLNGLTYIAIALTGAVALLSLLATQRLGAARYSEFAPTRHWLLGTLLLIQGAALLLQRHITGASND